MMTDLDVYRPRRLTPEHFYEFVVQVCGYKHCAPPPHVARAITLTSDGATVRLVIDHEDGQQSVGTFELDRGIRGML